MRVGIAVHLQAGLDQLVARRLDRDRLVVAQQVHEDVDVGFQRLAGVGGIESEHDRVRGERTGPNAEHRPSPGEVVKEHEAVGDHEGVVVRHGDHAGAELDVLGHLGGVRDEQHRVADRFDTAGVVLPEPGLDRMGFDEAWFGEHQASSKPMRSSS